MPPGPCASPLLVFARVRVGGFRGLVVVALPLPYSRLVAILDIVQVIREPLQ